MKNILLTLLFITSYSFAIPTNNSKKLFEKANNLYKKGAYEDAITQYKLVNNQKEESAALYYNLGNCYYKLQKVAPAIYYYEKALILEPNNKQIRTNLEYAQKLKIDEIQEVPKVGFSKIIHTLTSSYHYNTWGWIAVIFSAIFLLLFLGYFLLPQTNAKRIFFGLMALSLLFTAISVAAGFSEKEYYIDNRPAIVFQEIAIVRKEPNASGKEVTKIHAGTKIFVLETLNNYKKIELLDQTKGWINKNAIKEL
jgi:tetratricopeptide (TPR) repeat protein